MIALRSWGRASGKGYEVTPPADQQLVLSRRLLTPHRNSHHIRQLNLYLIHHYGRGYLSQDEDVTAPLLPPGRLPLWVKRTKEESDVSVLKMVKEECIHSLSVTVIHGYRKLSEEVRVWCQGQGWRYVREGRMNGIEDQCVVLLADWDSGYLESFSRGRNLLVVVTTRGDG